jgi:hypothetical protein
MHEETLRKYFTSEASAADLAEDLVGSLQRRGNVIEQAIVNMRQEFAVEPEHLAKLCRDVLASKIEPEYLRAVGFCLQASDKFVWDGSSPGGERVGETTMDWASPEVNFPLTLENAGRWLRYLETGEYRLNAG